MADLEVYMIIDGSGSMAGVKTDVVDGVNKFIDEQQDDAKATGDTILFTLVAFDDQVKEIFDAEDVTLANPITLKDTFLGGSTALNDAIGRTITKADDKNGVNKLVVVYTDGQENASREYKNDQIKKLIEDFQATGRWTFVYMSAELADFAQPANLGFSAGNTYTGATRGTTGQQFANISASTVTHRGSGGKMSETYFTDTLDASAVKNMGGTLGTDIVDSDPGDETDDDES